MWGGRRQSFSPCLRSPCVAVAVGLQARMPKLVAADRAAGDPAWLLPPHRELPPVRVADEGFVAATQSAPQMAQHHRASLKHTKCVFQKRRRQVDREYHAAHLRDQCSAHKKQRNGSSILLRFSRSKLSFHNFKPRLSLRSRGSGHGRRGEGYGDLAGVSGLGCSNGAIGLIVFRTKHGYGCRGGRGGAS